MPWQLQGVRAPIGLDATTFVFIMPKLILHKNRSRPLPYDSGHLLQRDVGSRQHRLTQALPLPVDASDLEAALGQEQHRDRFGVGVYDPVLFDAVLHVQIQLDRWVALGVTAPTRTMQNRDNLFASAR